MDKVEDVWRGLLARNRQTRDGASIAAGVATAGPGHVPDPARATTDAAALQDFLSLYGPLCQQPVAGASLVLGHLGQSLDGFIATRSGDSHFVNGAANIIHLHRLRALCDAVIVGAGTVAADDPRLTTRLVAGPNPVRVILDPWRRLGAHHQVFQDGAAETLLCARADADTGPAPGQAHLLVLPDGAGDRSDGEHDDQHPRGASGLDLAALLAALRARGLRRVFVEGGGVTVSAFLTAGLLQRLQLAVAPIIIGQGRPGITLPAQPTLGTALRPPVRIYRMGQDMLYDLDFVGSAPAPTAPDHDLPRRVA